MNFKFEFNGKTLTAKVPKNWQEVTVKQFQGMNFSHWDGKDIVHLLSILSGVGLKALYETESKPMEAVWAAMEFLKETPPDWTAIKHSKTLRFWGRDIKVPEDFDLEPFGLLVQFYQMSEEHDIPAICALYMQPAIDGYIDKTKQRTKEIHRWIIKMPIMEVLPVVNFFSKKSSEYLITGKPVFNLSP